MSVQFAPNRFTPTGIGNGEVQAVGIDVVPIFRGDEMSQSITVSMRRDLRIAFGAGGKVHQHQIVQFGIGGTGEHGGLFFQAHIEVQPTLSGFAADGDTTAYRRRIPQSRLTFADHFVLVSQHASGDFCRIETIFVVVLCQQIGRGNGYCAQFVQAQDREPELITAFQYQQYRVAFFDAQRLEEIGGSVGHFGHILEGEDFLVLVVIQPYHSRLMRRLLRDGVHDVESVVEVFRGVEIQLYQPALFIGFGSDELPVDGAGILCLYGVLGGRRFLDLGKRRGFFDDDRQKFAIALVCDHAVRQLCIVINAVAFAQNCGVIVYGDF